MVGLFFATTELMRRMNDHYPIRHWLFWVYARYWLLCAGWALACLAVGGAAVRPLVRDLPGREAQVLSFAAGVYVFFLAMFLGGLLGLYGPAFAILLPLALLGFGAKRLAKKLLRACRLVAAARRHLVRPLSVWQLIVAASGVVCVAVIYFSILSPENAAYDSRWYHLALAEHYAAAGRIARSPEGWVHAAYPQLSSIVYCWAFLLPQFSLFDRVALCAHLEFTLFLATLAQVPVLVRRLLPGADARATWVAFFLFPGLFLYDSCLSAAADHIAAFWAIPIFLALLRAFPSLEPRYCVLFALMLSAAGLTKYQSVALILPAVVAFATRAVMLAVRRWRTPERLAWLRGPSAAFAAVLVFTAPHWLKNLVWYGDPLYPMLHGILRSSPWHRDSSLLYDIVWIPQLWRPTGTTSEKLTETLRALYMFGFESHDWPGFHGAVPVFGSLFPLTVFAIPFLRGTRRLWGLFSCASGAVLIWYWTSHQARYLQVQLPWMVVVVASTIILVWRTIVLARVALVSLVGAQVVWGGDAFFIPSRSPTSLELSSSLLAAGYRREYGERFKILGDFSEAGKKLPKGVKFLIHEEHIHLGVRAMSVQDTPGFQGLINYGRLDSPRAVHDLLSSLGVTHLLWLTDFSYGWDTLAGDLRFFEYATRYAAQQTVFGAHTRAVVPSVPPEPPFDDRTVYFGCGKTFQSGLYQLSDLHVHEYSTDSSVAHPNTVYPAPRSNAKGEEELYAMVRDTRFVVLEPACHADAAARLSEFRREAQRGDREIWIRRKKE